MTGSSKEWNPLTWGTPDAAALIVRIVRGWADDMRDRMLTSCYQLIWKTPTAELFVLRAWKRPGLHAHSLQRFARHNGSLVTQSSGSDATLAGLWTARQGADGKVHGPCKLCSCLDWSLPCPSRMTWSHGRSRGLLGLLLRSINRSWSTIEGAVTDAGHRLRSYKCAVRAPGFEQFEDAELPMEVRNLCLKIPRKRCGVSLLGSAANTQHCMHVGLDQPAEAPTQTIEREEGSCDVAEH